MTAAAAGRLFGVGVGPGDPELVTLKAQRVHRRVRRRRVPGEAPRQPVARRAGRRPGSPAAHDELALVYPGDDRARPTTPEGYEGALRDFYDDGAEQIAALLDAGRDVAVLCEGDPFFYGSYMYLHERLADRYETEVVPGVTAFSAAAAAAGTPLAKRDDVLIVAARDAAGGRARRAPARRRRRRRDEARAHASTACARRSSSPASRERGVYVERASLRAASASRRSTTSTASVPYMSLVLVPTQRAAPRVARRRSRLARGRRARAGGAGVAHARRPAPRSRRPTSSSATAPTSTRVPRDAPGSAATPATTASSSTARGTRSSSRPAGVASPSCRRATRGSSRWRPRCSRPSSRATASSRTSSCASSPACRRCRPPPRASARRWATTSRSLAVRPAQAVGGDRAPARGRRRRRPRAGALQPGVAHAPRAARARARGPAAPPLAAASPSSSRATSAARPSRSTISTLGGFDAEQVDMRTLLIVGSSTTRVIRGPDGRELVYTPRSYP